jgi:hypothetical protein
MPLTLALTTALLAGCASGTTATMRSTTVIVCGDAGGLDPDLEEVVARIV